MRRIPNLGLLPILQVLLREQSVTRASEILGMTQSGTSTALRRLREAFDDPLLVQVGRKMVLTERARALIEPLEASLAALEECLRPQEFEPRGLKRQFRIWAIDSVALRVAELVLPRLQEVAPDVSLRFIDLSTSGVEINLSGGEVDMAIVPTGVIPADSSLLQSAFAYDDRFVAVVGPDHPLAGLSRLEPEHLTQNRCVAFQNGNDRWSRDELRDFAGYIVELAPAIQLEQLSLLPILALRTDTIAITLHSAAAAMARYVPLRVIELPNPSVFQEIHVVWSVVAARDPAHRWLRELILAELRSASEGMEAPSPA